MHLISLCANMMNCRSTCSVDNPLQTAVLNLFVSMKSRFSNLVVGSITRESVRKALANGITADQVRIGPPSRCHRLPIPPCPSSAIHVYHMPLLWLTMVSLDYQLPHDLRTPPDAQERELLHLSCHILLGLCLSPQKPLLPVTVQDQIRLWELERNRVKSQEGKIMEPSVLYAIMLTRRTLTQDIYTRHLPLRRTMSMC